MTRDNKGHSINAKESNSSRHINPNAYSRIIQEKIVALKSKQIHNFC